MPAFSSLLLTFLPLSPAPPQDPAPPDPTQARLEELAGRLDALHAKVDRLLAAFAPAPSRATSAELRQAWFEEHQRMAATAPHRDLLWQFLGPTNLSGRVTDLAVATPRGNTYTIFAATASGGVWKTENEGVSWEPIFEHEATASIGDVTLAPSNQEIVWVGTGEANIFRSSMAGHGVYKSSDGGATWRNMGLGDTHTIARIVVHPQDPDTVYVAASGNEWSENEERGVYRSRDGGASWERVLFVSPGAGAIDLVMDPGKPSILYAATWERTRKPWNDPRNHPGTAGSGLWRSLDGGDTWTAIDDGLPEARYRGRIGIDVAASNPSVLYAFVDCYEPLPEAPDATDSYQRQRRGGIQGAQVFRSDDRGQSWRRTSESDGFMQRLSATYGWVFGQVRVDPTDENKIYVMGLGLNVSEDGGKSFRTLRGMHGDHHALWIDPVNPAYLVNGNDGGLVVSYDGGLRWRRFTDNLPAVQFYNVGYDMAEPFRVYGSIQDHGSYRGVVDLTRGRDRLRASEWESVPGGEASYHQVDPTDPDTVYFESFYGAIGRADLASGERARIAPQAGAGEEELRGQWLAPFLISPHNPRILYHGMNRLYRSLDRGERFAPISPDLSHDRADRRGDIPYQTITAIAESPLRFGLLYAGTDDGRLHVTRDSGASWTEITAGLAEERWISRVVASSAAEGTVYVAQNGKRNEDFAASLWVSRDYGASWRSLAGGLPGGPINVVREDPQDPALLYAGSDLGVYLSPDRGASWQVLGGGLPTTYVHDLIVHPRDDVIVIATHGRGMWALDARALREPPAAASAATETAAD